MRKLSKRTMTSTGHESHSNASGSCVNTQNIHTVTAVLTPEEQLDVYNQDTQPNDGFQVVNRGFVRANKSKISTAERNVFLKYLRCLKYYFTYEDMVYDKLVFRNVRVPMIQKGLERIRCNLCTLRFFPEVHSYEYQGRDGHEYCMRHRFTASLTPVIKDQYEASAKKVMKYGEKFHAVSFELDQFTREELFANLYATFSGDLTWYAQGVKFENFPLFITAKRFYRTLAQMIELVSIKAHIDPLYLGCLLGGLKVSTVFSNRAIQLLLANPKNAPIGIVWYKDLKTTRKNFFKHGLIKSYSKFFSDYYVRCPSRYDSIKVKQKHLEAFRSIGSCYYRQWTTWFLRKDFWGFVNGHSIVLNRAHDDFQAAYEASKINFEDHMSEPESQNNFSMHFHDATVMLLRGGAKTEPDPLIPDPANPVAGQARVNRRDSGRRSFRNKGKDYKPKSPQAVPAVAQPKPVEGSVKPPVLAPQVPVVETIPQPAVPEAVKAPSTSSAQVQKTNSSKSSRSRDQKKKEIKLANYVFTHNGVRVNFKSPRDMVQDVSSKGNRCGYYVMLKIAKLHHPCLRSMTDDDALPFFRDIYAFAGYGAADDSMITPADIVVGLAVLGIACNVYIPVQIGERSYFEQVAGSSHSANLCKRGGKHVPVSKVLLSSAHYQHLVHDSGYIRPPTEYRPVRISINEIITLPSISGTKPKTPKTNRPILFQPPTSLTYTSPFMGQFLSQICHPLDKAYVFQYVPVLDEFLPLIPRSEFLGTDDKYPEEWRESDEKRIRNLCSALSVVERPKLHVLQHQILKDIEDGQFSYHMESFVNLSSELSGTIDQWLNSGTSSSPSQGTAGGPDSSRVQSPVTSNTASDSDSDDESGEDFPPLSTSSVAGDEGSQKTTTPVAPVAPLLPVVAPLPAIPKPPTQTIVQWKAKNALYKSAWFSPSKRTKVCSDLGCLCKKVSKALQLSTRSKENLSMWKTWREIPFKSLTQELTIFYYARVADRSLSFRTAAEIPQEYRTKESLLKSSIKAHFYATRFQNALILVINAHNCTRELYKPIRCQYGNFYVTYESCALKEMLLNDKPSWVLRHDDVVKNDPSTNLNKSLDNSHKLFFQIPESVGGTRPYNHKLSPDVCYTRKSKWGKLNISIPHFVHPVLSPVEKLTYQCNFEGNLAKDLYALRTFEVDAILDIITTQEVDVIPPPDDPYVNPEVFQSLKEIEEKKGHIYEVHDVATRVPLLNLLTCFTKYGSVYSYYDEPEEDSVNPISGTDQRAIAYRNDKNTVGAELMTTTIHPVIINPAKRTWWDALVAPVQKAAKILAPVTCVLSAATCCIPGGCIPVALGCAGVSCATGCVTSAVALEYLDEKRKLGCYARRHDDLVFDAQTIKNITSWTNFTNGNHDEYAKIIVARVNQTLPFSNIDMEDALCHGRTDTNVLESTRVFAVAHYWHRYLKYKALIESTKRASVDSHKANHYSIV